MEDTLQQTGIAFNTMPDRLLTVKQTADILGITEKSLRNRIDRNEGPPLIRLSPRTLRYSEKELMDWIASRAETQASATNQ